MPNRLGKHIVTIATSDGGITYNPGTIVDIGYVIPKWLEGKVNKLGADGKPIKEVSGGKPRKTNGNNNNSRKS